MSRKLIPSFVLDAYAVNRLREEQQAVCLFVDTSGFTRLTGALMQQGTEGAEILAQVLANIFTPLLAIIYRQGGFVAGFAGDAFKAIFPGLSVETHQRATTAAWQIYQQMRSTPLQRTRFGDFPFAVKVSMSNGRVDWCIWRAAEATSTETPSTETPTAMTQQAALLFGGAALEQALAVDPFVQAGEVVMTAQVAAHLPLADARLEAVGEHFRLLAWAKATLPVSPPIDERPTARRQPLRASLAHHFFPKDLLERQTQGEFRRVVTLFINLQRLPSNEATGEFVATLFRLLGQYGGYLCRIGQIGALDRGGTLLLFWGAPTSHENDVARALNFVLALQAATSIPMRAGVTAGLAYAGFVGSPLRQEYTCYGAHVNLAARQMVMAGWGEIWLDAETRRFAQATFDLGEQRMVNFKGFAEAHPVYRLIQRREPTMENFYRTELVGREAELSQLQAALAPLTVGKFAGVITLIGEAGMGKSRLVHELQRQLDARQGDKETRRQGEGEIDTYHASLSPPLPVSLSAQWFLCQTDEILRQSLNPFRYWLRSYFNQSTSQSEAANKERFTTKLDDLLNALDTNRLTKDEQSKIQNLKSEIDRTRSFLGALVDQHWSDSLYEQVAPQLRFENTLRALKTLILAESLRQPVILHLEDAHWLDADSSTFLAHLTHNAEAYPFALIITSRPPTETGERESTPLIAAEVAQLTVMLSGLNPASLTRLATALLAAPPAPDLLALVAARAEGNPFFAEQLLLYLQEQQLLEQGVAGWQLRANLSAAHASLGSIVPNEARSVLVARLDRLAQGVKETVQTAAVLGREFSVDLLFQMLHQQTTLSAHLQSAEAAAIWLALNQVRYLFKHALLRDAAYDMQLRSHLRSLHELAAASIQQLYAVDLTPHYASLAYHSEQADQIKAAVAWHTLAGEQSSDQYANQSARFHFEQALSLLDKPIRPEPLPPETSPPEPTPPVTDNQRRFSLFLRLVNLYDRIGDLPAQQQALAQLHHLAQRLGDPSAQVRVMVLQAELDVAIGNYPAAITRMQEATQRAQQSQDAKNEAKCCLALGWAYVFKCEYPPARHWLEQARTLALAIGDHRSEANALSSLGRLAWDQNEDDLALQWFEAALLLARRLNDCKLESYILIHIGVVLWFHQGKTDESEGLMRQALHLSRAIGDRFDEAGALFNLANLLLYCGRVEDATTYSRLANSLWDEVKNRIGVALTLVPLSHIACYQGDLLNALNDGRQTYTILHSLDAKTSESESMENLANILGALGDEGSAKHYLEASLRLGQEIRNNRVEGKAWSTLGRYWYRQDAHEAACHAFQQALPLNRLTGEQGYELTSLAYQGHALYALGRFAEATESYQQVLQLKAQWWGDSRILLTGFAAFLHALVGLARLAQEQHRQAEAQAYLERLLHHLNDAPLDARLNPQWIYLTCYRLLRAVGDPRASELLITAHHALQTQATHLTDEALRRSFLENVGEHRELLAEVRRFIG